MKAQVYVYEKVVSLAFLIGGVVLAIIGINGSRVFSPGVSNGSSSDMALWMLVGGLFIAFVGLVATWRSWKQPAHPTESVYER